MTLKTSSNLRPSGHLGQISVLVAALGSLALSSCGSSSSRRLDERYPDPVMAGLKLEGREEEPRVSLERLLERIEPGDIIAFGSSDTSSHGSTMLAAALGSYTHIAIAYPSSGGVHALTADSDLGVRTETIERCVAGRDFFVYAFPSGLLSDSRLQAFARQAERRGTFDYDWSAALFGLNSNLTPNEFGEVGDEYTCATVVAAALHFSGLSLDRAYRYAQFVAPGDILFSPARRNLNGPARGARAPSRSAGDGRESKRQEP